jgi:C-terminal processing protease CtpA/Prc
MNKKLITTLTLVGLCMPLVPLAAGESEPKKKRCSQEAQKCIHAMTEQFKNRGWIGIEMDKGKDRQIITKVVSESPAERAGLQTGDAIVEFNGLALSEGEKAVYAAMKKALVPGHTVTLGIERDGTRRDVEVILSEVPRQLLAQWVGQHVLDQHSEAPEASEAPESPGD